MNVYMKSLSTLSTKELVHGVATGSWPNIESQIITAHKIGASGVELSILRGWRERYNIVRDIIRLHGDIVALDGPKFSHTVPPFFERRLYGPNAKRVFSQILYDVHVGMGSNNHIYTTEHTCGLGSLSVLADLEDRLNFATGLLSGHEVDSRRLVLNTWNIRELVTELSWARSTWNRQLYREVTSINPENSRYFSEQCDTNYVDQLLRLQIARALPHTDIIQIESRDWKEVLRSIRGLPTMLSVQVAQINATLRMDQRQRNQLPIVVVVPMSWWTIRQKQHFVAWVKHELRMIR